jgi:SHS2 domain-containing protein
MAKAKGYEFVDHTADVEFVARGKTTEELFKNALLAQFDTLADVNKIAKSEAKEQAFTINERARAIEDLLWFVLQDALSVSDAEGLYGYGVKSISIIENGEYEIKVVASAKKKERRFSKLDVKGVSKFDLKVIKGPKGFEASVVLDV